jgi:hypothetical protein
MDETVTFWACFSFPTPDIVVYLVLMFNYSIIESVYRVIILCPALQGGEMRGSLIQVWEQLYASGDTLLSISKIFAASRVG